jgi:hypothetical protein
LVVTKAASVNWSREKKKAKVDEKKPKAGDRMTEWKKKDLAGKIR